MTDTINLPREVVELWAKAVGNIMGDCHDDTEMLKDLGQSIKDALAAPQPEGDAERQKRDMATAYGLFSNLKLHGEYAALKVAFGSLWPAAFSHGFQTAKVIYKPEPQPVKQAPPKGWMPDALRRAGFPEGEKP